METDQPEADENGIVEYTFRSNRDKKGVSQARSSSDPRFRIHRLIEYRLLSTAGGRITHMLERPLEYLVVLYSHA